MEQINPPKKATVIHEVVGSVKIVESEMAVKVPVFEDIRVERPIYVDKPIEVPTGFDEIAVELSERIAKKILDKIELTIGARLDKAIDERISSIKSPKIIEEVTITHKDIEVERPVYKDIEISRPTYVDKEIINPILKDVTVLNAKIEEVTVINAVITDQKITNAIIRDVEVERAVIREKVVDVIHPRYLNLKGEPE